MNCEHLHLQAEAGTMVRVLDQQDEPLEYVLDIRVKCADCGRAFWFFGPAGGPPMEWPTVSKDRRTLSIMVEPVTP